jgi:hypothetical protein
MRVFTKDGERYYDSYLGKHRTRRKLTIPGKLTLALVTGLTLYGLFSDSSADVLGDVNTAESIPASEVNATIDNEVADRYARTFDNASPAGRFALQYLTETDIAVEARQREANNGQGFLGWVTGDNEDIIARVVTYRNGCLNKSSYDINGGDIEGIISGVFTSGYIQGDIPTAGASAFVDSADPDKLIVASGQANSRDLTFSGLIEGDELIPANQQTVDILDTYGCTSGTTTEPRAVDVDYAYSSPWVVQP